MTRIIAFIIFFFSVSYCFAQDNCYSEQELKQRTSSSSEAFVLDAKQSKKVKGTPTWTQFAVDYLENKK